jgi:hypothetical protein
MEIKENSIQARLFERISKTLPSSISLVDELSEVLNISNDSIYRRLKGETALSIHEIELLCNMYMISFDSLCKYAGNTVTFDFNPMVDQVNYKNYLLSIMNDLEIVQKSQKGKIIYAGEDIPLFHNFGFPTLAKFKLFYWMKSIMNIESLQGKRYDPQLVDQEILSIGKELYDLYAQIPSIEIWTEVTPISLFKQIEFFWESGIFQSKEDALAICDDAREEFLLLEKEAEIGCKFDSKRNLVNTFNKLTTRNKFFCEEIDKWLKNLIRKSNLISGISEKQRYRFFKRLNEALNITRNTIMTS